MSDKTWNNIAKTAVDAFDVDIQLFIGKLLKQLRETPTGIVIANWAENNSLAFEALLRLISASVQRLPKHDSILLDTVSDQLKRLPVEVRRAVMETDCNSQKSTPSDENFRTRYEEALEGLTDEELGNIVSLSKNQLKEWVDSPARIRPHLLKKWKEEQVEKDQNSTSVFKPISDGFSKLEEACADGGPVDTWLKKLTEKSQKFRDDAEKFRDNSKRK